MSVTTPTTGQKISDFSEGIVDANSYFIQARNGGTSKAPATKIGQFSNLNLLFTGEGGLNTTNKTIVGAINEVNGKIIDANITSPAEGDVIAYDSESSKWVNFDLGAMESAATASANPVTCANNTYTECVNLTINKGLYLFIGMLAFDTNTTGVREINISSASGDSGIAATRLTVNACQSGQTRFQTLYVTKVTRDSATFYLNAKQNSGAALDVIYSRLLAVKIGM